MKAKKKYEHFFSVYVKSSRFSIPIKQRIKRTGLFSSEQHFFRNKSAERLQIEEKRDELVESAIIASIVHGEKHSRTVLEQILLHFWGVREYKDRQENSNAKTFSKPDFSELEAIKYHELLPSMV